MQEMPGGIGRFTRTSITTKDVRTICTKHWTIGVKMETKIYYSVQNMGDGSAYPEFMSSMKLAEYDQDNMDEGWGESCTGSLTIESDSPITVKEGITTPEGYLVNLIDVSIDENDQEKVKKFIKTFFPKGLPEFKVRTRKV